MLKNGGMVRTRGADGRRTGDHYLILDDGMGSIFGMNFVDGYLVGPDLTLGFIDDTYTRWELDIDAKWAFSREAFAGVLAFRCIMPPQTGTRLEFFGGQQSVDFDPEPLMPVGHQALAGSLLGWNDGKLYLSTTAGFRSSFAASGDVQLGIGLWWEKREREWQHKWRNLFRTKMQDNVPRINGHDVETWQEDPLLHWQTERIIRLDVDLEYTPQRMFYIIDDMTVIEKSKWPTFGVSLKTGVDHDFSRGWRSLRFLSLDFSMKNTKQWALHNNQWRYYTSMGFFPIHSWVHLADMRHFDASDFQWQVNDGLRWFSLLTNYEMSSNRSWIEGHGELSGENILLSRLSSNRSFREYIQLHALQTYRRDPHIEFSYGIDIKRKFRLGGTVGLEGRYYDGTTFNVIFAL